MPQEEEFDWEGLALLGSLLGNAVQYQKNSTAKQQIAQLEHHVHELFRDRESLQNTIGRFQQAVTELKQKINQLESINQKYRDENHQLKDEVEKLKKLLDEKNSNGGNQ